MAFRLHLRMFEHQGQTSHSWTADSGQHRDGQLTSELSTCTRAHRLEQVPFSTNTRLWPSQLAVLNYALKHSLHSLKFQPPGQDTCDSDPTIPFALQLRPQIFSRSGSAMVGCSALTLVLPHMPPRPRNVGVVSVGGACRSRSCAAVQVVAHCVVSTP